MLFSLRSAVANAALCAARSAAFVQQRDRRLVISPAAPGSVGDSAMIESAIGGWRKHSSRHVDLMTAHEWPIDIEPDATVDLEELSDTNRRMLLARAVRGLAQYEYAGLIGADILDGAYGATQVLGRLTILSEVARQGRGIVFGSSFGARPDIRVVDVLRRLPDSIIICARDPVSLHRMEACLNRPIRLVADLAFLTAPDAKHPIGAGCVEWISARHAAGDQVVGFNINHLQASRIDGLREACEEVVARLLGAGVSVLLVPHDTRGSQSDVAIAQALTRNLAKFGNRLCMLTPDRPSMMRYVLSHIDLMITGRMHAAILAMGGATPALSLVYQGKFEGLYRLFDLDQRDLLLEPAIVRDKPRVFAEGILAALARAPQLRAHISTRLEAVRSLAEKNFDA